MHGLVQKILETCEGVANIFLYPGANYTYMYNLHTVCKSAHVTGALFYLSLNALESSIIQLKSSLIQIHSSLFVLIPNVVNNCSILIPLKSSLIL